MSGPGRYPTRRDAPVWRQVAEGIGLVVAISGLVVATAVVVALVVALLF